MRLSDLSPRRRKLTLSMRELQFGEMLGLEVEDGEPVLTPPPGIVRDVLHAKDDRKTGSRSPIDFELKQEIIDLLEAFDREQNCKFEVIFVKHGLPFRSRLVDCNAQRRLGTIE